MINKLTYKHTMACCFMAYITSAVINNFAPLLFLTFQKSYNITVFQLGFLVAVNFLTQMIVDYLGAKYAYKIGYRRTIVMGLAFSASGLILMGIMPDIMDNKYLALLIAVFIYAIGSGIIEVMISPITEALPTKNKDAVMSLIHSSFCWGMVLVVLVSTVYFRVIGVDKWKYLSIFWGLLPIVTAIGFLKVPIYVLDGEDDAPVKIKDLFKNKLFPVFMLLMTCSGAAEVAMAQWASYFAEEGLRVSKTMGDLLGPCLFAVLMGSTRVIYARFSRRLNLIKVIKYCTVLCVISYVLATLVPHPIIALIGCGLCGASVGIMWPGVLSVASNQMPKSTTAMFATLAVAGDIGCSLGPQIVSLGASCFKIGGSNIKAGLFCVIVFPVIMYIALNWLSKLTLKNQKTT